MNELYNAFRRDIIKMKITNVDAAYDIRNYIFNGYFMFIHLYNQCPQQRRLRVTSPALKQTDSSATTSEASSAPVASGNEVVSY